MDRFTDKIKAARLLKETFETGDLQGTEMPAGVRCRNVDFMKYSQKAFSEKFRKFSQRYGTGLFLVKCCGIVN